MGDEPVAGEGGELSNDHFRARDILKILHGIVASESIPVAFGITPTETGDSYIRIFDHDNDHLGGRAAEISQLHESRSIQGVPSHP
jgi:hypothetical protein